MFTDLYTILVIFQILTVSFLLSIEMDSLPTVKTAAEIFRRFCYNNRDSLMAGIIVAGWDPKLGGQVPKHF